MHRRAPGPHRAYTLVRLLGPASRHEACHTLLGARLVEGSNITLVMLSAQPSGCSADHTGPLTPTSHATVVQSPTKPDGRPSSSAAHLPSSSAAYLSSHQGSRFLGERPTARRRAGTRPDGSTAERVVYLDSRMRSLSSSVPLRASPVPYHSPSPLQV